MDAVILRFPHISRQIFEHLDVKSVTKCRIIARLWNESLCAERFFWIEIIQHLTYTEEVWITILRKSNLDQLSKISREICNYYCETGMLAEIQWNYSPILMSPIQDWVDATPSPTSSSDVERDTTKSGDNR